jgi:hypothetical protein
MQYAIGIMIGYYPYGGDGGGPGPQFVYFRPDATSLYRRPDGVSIYFRP